jgi:hypothetical protein
MNANIFRNPGQFEPTSETGFYEKSLWEKAKSREAALQKLVDEGLNNTGIRILRSVCCKKGGFLKEPLSVVC